MFNGERRPALVVLILITIYLAVKEKASNKLISVFRTRRRTYYKGHASRSSVSGVRPEACFKVITVCLEGIFLDHEGLSH